MGCLRYMRRRRRYRYRRCYKQPTGLFVGEGSGYAATAARSAATRKQCSGQEIAYNRKVGLRGEMVYAVDLKSIASACGFESHRRHFRKPGLDAGFPCFSNGFRMVCNSLQITPNHCNYRKSVGKMWARNRCRIDVRRMCRWLRMRYVHACPRIS